VLRFNAEGPEGLATRNALEEIIETGPIPAAHGVVRWRIIDLARWLREAMSMHLEEIAFHVAPGAQAVLLLDQAGWHGSAELVVPDIITLMPLPPSRLLKNSRQIPR